MFATEVEPTTIPQGLDEMEPGPFLSAILASIDVDTLTGRAAVIFARAQQRQISHEQARHYQALSRVNDLYLETGDPDMPEFAAVETGAAMTWTRRTADREMGVAYDIVKRHPALFEALRRGLIDVPKTRTILRGLAHADVEVADMTIALILPEAPGLTTGQIASRLRRLVIEADPEKAREVYEEAVADARVWAQIQPDGSGTMVATGLEAEDLAAGSENIERLARKLREAGDDRPMDKLRSIAFALLLRGEPDLHARRGTVRITGDLATLRDLDDLPGELDGYGLVNADILRQIVSRQHDTVWEYEIIDRETGEIHVGTLSRRPTAGQRRQLRARYKTCINPTCRRPVARCDIDHTEDWVKGGLTTLCNLAPLCRYHHRNKHKTSWSYRKLADGTIEWTSQFGLKYLTHPPP